jgi:hypothetical protein
VSGLTPTFGEGVAVARAALKEGRGLQALERLRHALTPLVPDLP